MDIDKSKDLYTITNMDDLHDYLNLDGEKIIDVKANHDRMVIVLQITGIKRHVSDFSDLLDTY